MSFHMQRNQYLLTIIDWWWVEAVPLQDIGASTVVQALIKEWITHYGISNWITSNWGTQFHPF